jgi:hypothetical protein|tara:strand:+ start:529 stop:786 length:258 start_codon:yes stop_codon:yes gene_type:complete
LKKIILSALFILTTLSCDEDSKCNKCGNISGGMVTMKVSASDLARYEGLASVNDVDVGTCIKAYIYEEELFINSIMVLDECCCEL